MALSDDRLRTIVAEHGHEGMHPSGLRIARAIAAEAHRDGQEEMRERALRALDDFRWEEHDKGCDERLGDGSPGVIAACYQRVERIGQGETNGD